MPHQFPTDLLNGVSTAPGRVRSFLESPEKNLLPHSCTLRVYKNDLYGMMRLTSQDLRGGSGVKIVLDNFEKPNPVNFRWWFNLSKNHPDFDKMTALQQNYLFSPYSNPHANPVVISVADSMEGTFTGQYSIEESWSAFIDAAMKGQDVIVDLSSLRPCGTENSLGLTATGAIGDGTEESNESSFFAIYKAIAEYLQNGSVLSLLTLFGTLNGTLRRGGLYKNGIITSSMDYRNDCFLEYLNALINDIPGSHKKAARLDLDVLDDLELVNLICTKGNTESLFLEKIQGNGLYQNVCEALFIQDGGTCLIWRVNLGMCESPESIVAAYVETATHLTHLHATWRNQVGFRADNYRPVELDKQIGLDTMGLGNYLSLNSISYEQFFSCVHSFLNDNSLKEFSTVCVDTVYYIAYGMKLACLISDKIMIEDYGLEPLERIFTVEPAMSHSFQTKDLKGFTTTRGIFLPYARKVRRKSDAQKSRLYNYGEVEVASNYSPEEWQGFLETWQELMNTTGRAHGISFDTYREIDKDWLKDFLMNSNLQSKYYTEIFDYDQSYLRKVAQTATEEVCSLENKGCEVCAE